MRRVLAGMAVGLVAGAVGQRLAEAQDLRRFPMPGRLVEANGNPVHVVVEGSGPVVVIDSGLGGSCLEWSSVAADLVRDFTVVRYDRPGFGWSPAAPGDRSPVAAARRLRALISALDLPAPVLLVGHSLGGLHVRVFACLYPELVRGLVLVDPSHEDMLDDPSAARSTAVMNRVMSLFAATAFLGTPRIAGRLYTRMVAAQIRRALDESDREALHQSTLLTACSIGGLRAAVAEMTAVPQSLRQVTSLGQPLPDVPVTLITAAAPARTPSEEKARTAIHVLHESQVAGMPHGRLVLAHESGHLVPIDEPQLVASCVREVAAASVDAALPSA